MESKEGLEKLVKEGSPCLTRCNTPTCLAKKSSITITCSSGTSSTSSQRSLLESSFGTLTVKKCFPRSLEITPSPCSSNSSWTKSGGRKAELDSQTVSPVLVSKKSAAEVSASNHSLTPSVKAVKRKILDDFDMVEIDHRLKKLKLNSDPNSWRSSGPTVFGISSKHQAPHDHTSESEKKFCSSVVSMPMNDHTTSALDMLSSAEFNKTYPLPAILHSVMTEILRDSTGSCCSYRAYSILRAVLNEHPPHPNNPALRDAYIQSLRSNGQTHGTPDEEWRFLDSIISPLVLIPEDDKAESPNSKDNCSLLLQFVVALLESDMANLLASKARCELNQRDVRQSIIGRVFWPGYQPVALNKHCQEILDILSAALDVWKNDQSNSVVVDLLLKIVSMLASCLRIADQTDHQPCHILKGERVSSLVRVLTRRLTDVPECVLQIALPRLNPPWFGLGVCHLLTQTLDDSLLPPTLCLEEEMTMTSILTHDLYLLPHLVRCTDSPMKNSNSMLNDDSPHECPLSARAADKGGLYSRPNLSTTSESSASTSSISSVPKTPRSFSKFLSKLNKRNAQDQKLLEARTKVGCRAVDLCETEEIRLALMPCSDIPCRPHKRRKISNQFSEGSQDSQNSFLFSQEMYGTPQGPCPSEEMYTALLGEDPRRSHVSREECLKYMCVLQHKIRLYVTCHKLTVHVAALHWATNEENSKNDLKAVLVGNSSDKTWTKSNPASVMPDVINLQKFNENLKKKIRMPEVLKQLEKDVNAYSKIGEHVEGFRRHIKQICSETDYKDLKVRLESWVCMCV